MRKNSPRKWVHAILDLLPLVLIPIFALAVRSDNNFQPIEITATEPVYYDSNVVESGSDLAIGNVYRWIDNYVTNPNYTNVTILNIEPNEMIKNQFNISDDSINNVTLRLNAAGYCNLMFYEDSTLKTYVTVGNQVFDFVLSNYNPNEINNFIPHITECNVLYLKEYNTNVLYNDTDVGSQLVYTLYNASEKYFNFRQVANFNDIYNWLETNMFNGNAPLIVPVVFNIILYELIMDIIFLLYAVFMFIVDFAERMLDCLFDKSFGGGK